MMTTRPYYQNLGFLFSDHEVVPEELVDCFVIIFNNGKVMEE